MKAIKTMPKFKTEAEEQVFWDTHDVTDYFDMLQAKKTTLPNLKKTTKLISIRLPVDMIDQLKVKANAMDVPYQSLIKVILQKELAC